MNDLHVFQPIPLATPIEAVYRRLAFSSQSTLVSEAQRKVIAAYIDEAVCKISLRGVFRRVKIAECNDKEVVLITGDRFVSRDIAGFLHQCDEAVCMGATSGEEIVSEIQRLSAGENVTKSVVFDAVASEMTDAAVQWLMEYVQRDSYRQQKLLMKKRFSCGYGDFSLANQKIFYSILDLSALHITLTEQCILIPEKSVTAVSGIYPASGSA